eukprot:CAMPEP_0196662960 /NCGR_PEP_ID=MMETSP1086-20130531/51021_1 /TAXON_ID=77921 /ORGANISM="Cyanoptyche  gloeocystis , Strain SAG4.97" /LENGTH=436 /DNA_ID=CAMNT_0041998597 /DNA_START=85 /DNA_END=1395 /DNA_ORIENTATION=+
MAGFVAAFPSLTASCTPVFTSASSGVKPVQSSFLSKADSKSLEGARAKFFGTRPAARFSASSFEFDKSAKTVLTVTSQAGAPAKKLSVGVLGATGSVGQRFLQLLEGHPWFEVKALGASSRSAGKAYQDAANWKQSTPIPADCAEMMVTECKPELLGVPDVIFSGLDADVAGPIEESFAQAGSAVFSNAKNHRMDDDVPILIPHCNADHLDIVAHQKKIRGYDKGFIVTNANCSSTGLAIALKPIDDAFGIDCFMVVTMQAISGAGYPGLPSMDILDNVVPFIGGEEEKMESEPQKILAKLNADKTAFVNAGFKSSAHCNRVHVLDGHTESVSIKLKTKGVTPEDIKRVLRNHTSIAQELKMPSAPEKCIIVTDVPNRPQTRLDRMVGGGYTVTVGRVRPCNLFDIRFTLLSHNTIIGAAGGSIQNAELAVVKGLI